MNKIFLLLLLTGFFHSSVLAQNPLFEMRRETYIDSCLANLNRDALVQQAYRGIPVDSALLQAMINDVPTRSTADFVIIQLVRIMRLDTAARYDTLIMPMLDTLPFWLEFDDDLRSYWSENHWCMWNGSNWLLHEHYGKAVDSTLRNRLGHYLRMKVNYGFYEFMSPIYAPYTMAGLLNLADFALDPEIKQLATQAVNRLLRELLYTVNDKGVWYPAAGRSTHSNYRSTQSPRAMFYLLTGQGEPRTRPSHSGGFISTTSIDVNGIMNAYRTHEDTILRIGHTIDSSFILNDSLTDFDRVLFQWSGGGYFHPDFADESVDLVFDYDVWGHPDFSEFDFFSTFSATAIKELAKELYFITEGSVLMDETYHVFKHNAVTLTSVEDYFKGSAGYQQTPLMANVGRTSVYTSSGEVVPNIENKSGFNNSHFPYVKQKGNIALAMYWPNPNLKGFGAFGGYGDQEVALKWKYNEFDQVAESGNWVLARQDENYIAVYRACTDSIVGNWACTNTDGQAWVYIIGDSSMYQNFSGFQQVVAQATVTENRAYTEADTTQWLYYAQVEIDGQTIAYEWTRDTVATSVPDIATLASRFTVYPNPADDFVMLVTPDGQRLQTQVTVTNLIGQQIYGFSGPVDGNGLRINTNQWARGLYLVNLQTELGVETQRLLVR